MRERRQKTRKKHIKPNGKGHITKKSEENFPMAKKVPPSVPNSPLPSPPLTSAQLTPVRAAAPLQLPRIKIRKSFGLKFFLNFLGLSDDGKAAPLVPTINNIIKQISRATTEVENSNFPPLLNLPKCEIWREAGQCY